MRLCPGWHLTDQGEIMRIMIATGFVAAVLLSLTPAAIAAPDGLTLRMKQVRPLYTPVPKFQLAACRFWQCNCHSECVIYEGDRCVRSVRSCETCSSCD
jgi:hypothetical protein